MPVTPGHDGKIEQLAVIVASGGVIADQAEGFGVSVRTLYRWASEDSFKRRVERIRERAVREAVGLLAANSTRAALTLVALLDEAQPANIRLAAARAIVADMIAIQSHNELVARIAELEARLDGTARPPEPDRTFDAPGDGVG
jgi:hypothetical protein